MNYYQSPKPEPDNPVYSRIQWFMIIIGVLVIAWQMHIYYQNHVACLPDPNYPIEPLTHESITQTH